LLFNIGGSVLKNLVIVESPAKSKTIETYLSGDFVVTSSVGHIRDLATSGKYGLGVDVENDFTPTYKTISGKGKVIREIKKEAKDATTIYLATDPDREGEAISWHLAEVLDLDPAKIQRVVFHEITKKAVQEAIKDPRQIDMDLVHSQEARRILDRIIGFRLSKLLQAKIKSKSAGRVQSVALRLIVEREREIAAFVPVEYWEVVAAHQFSQDDVVPFKLQKYQGEKLELGDEAAVNVVLAALKDDQYKVSDVSTKKSTRAPKLPFTTSRLQQEAANKLGFSARRTMSVAQKLYEGQKIGDETVGLITYMRTDSTRLSDDFVTEAFTFIEQTYGDAYKGIKPKTKKKENTQDAHEGIRPTSVLRTPESIEQYLTPEEYKLYHLIWTKAVASLMAKAEFENTKVVLDNNGYQFQANGQVLLFEGHLKIAKAYEKITDQLLPVYTAGTYVAPVTIEPSQHFTQPPARYSEATLVKTLEEQGIGRPSTYATIIDTIQKRGYVTLDQKRFFPSDQGMLTSDKLTENFNDIVNVDYTAQLEDALDQIAQGKLDEVDFLKDFYTKFEPILDEAYEKMETIAPKETGEACPECGNPLVFRRSRYGEFIGCSTYPDCKYIKPLEGKEPKETDITCPKCKEGRMSEKRTRRGKIFWGCNRYPDCDFATWYEPTGEMCEDGNGIVVKKGEEFICETPKAVSEKQAKTKAKAKPKTKKKE